MICGVDEGRVISQEIVLVAGPLEENLRVDMSHRGFPVFRRY